MATCALAFAPAIIAERLDETVTALAAHDHARAAHEIVDLEALLRDLDSRQP